MVVNDFTSAQPHVRYILKKFPNFLKIPSFLCPDIHPVIVVLWCKQKTLVLEFVINIYYRV